MEYSQEDYLQLSGLQHFKLCRRQWALIHIENQWVDNFLTVDGTLMHEHAHSKGFQQRRGDVIITRGMSIHSRQLGIAGECDVVEFTKGNRGVELTGREGLWQPFPVEYKRGKPNTQSGDTLQLCAQAMCLEEMLCCKVERGAIYYGQLHHREEVCLDDTLRSAVRESLIQMHDLFRRGHTPRVKPTKACNACSLKDICLPKMMTRRSVEEYLRGSMEAEL